MSASGTGRTTFDLRLLEPFVVLADEELHFGRAARRLGISQPGLSRQLVRLQRQLGTTLVVRDERRTLLTPAGARLLARSRSVLHRAGALSEELRAAADTLRIHMGVGAHRGARELVTSFMATHTSTRLEITEGFSSGARNSLLAKAVDVAFELRTGCPPSMCFELIDRSPLGVLTTSRHPLARRGTARWADLAGERVLFGPSKGGSWNTLVRGCLADAGVTVTEYIAPALPRIHYLVPLVGRGEALMITGLALFDAVPDGLAWTALTPDRHLEFGAMWDPRRGTPAVRRFVEFVRQSTAAVPTPTPTPGPGTSNHRVAADPSCDTRTVAPRPGFDLRLLHPFVTVAEERHFGHAAEKLLIAQPALSRQVAQLEAQLGVTLLDRSTRSIELTDAGRLTLAAAREILGAVVRGICSDEATT